MSLRRIRGLSTRSGEVMLELHTVEERRDKIRVMARDHHVATVADLCNGDLYVRLYNPHGRDVAFRICQDGTTRPEKQPEQSRSS